MNGLSAPTMQRTGWIRRRAVKDVLEKVRGRNGYSSFLPTPSSTRTMTGVSLRTIKPGQKTIPMPEDSDASRHCAYLVVDGVNPGLTDLFTRQARKTMQEQQKKFCPAKSSNRNRLPAKPAAPKETGSRSDEQPQKRKRDVPVLFLGIRCGDGSDPAEKWQQFGTKKPERLSAEKWLWTAMWCSWTLPELKELVSLLRRSSNNLNHLTRKVHETGRIYDADLGGYIPAAGTVMGRS